MFTEILAEITVTGYRECTAADIVRGRAHCKFWLCNFRQTTMSMRVLIACKRVIDYAVKVTIHSVYLEDLRIVSQYIQPKLGVIVDLF